MNRNPTLSRRALRPISCLAAVLALAAAGGVQAQSAAAPAAAASAPSGPTVRPEAAKPLVAAQEALRDNRFADAQARLAEAEALPGLTPYESYVITRLKAAAVFSSGDMAQAITLFERALDTPFPSPADRTRDTEITIKLSLQAKDYPRAVRWIKKYLADGGKNEEIRRLYPQVLNIQGDHAGAAAVLADDIRAAEARGETVPEATLRQLASSQSLAEDNAGYLATLEKLTRQTGKPEYWSELIARAARREGFAGERLQLDIYRLKRAVGVPLSAGELGDMAYRAQQAGLPGEAQKLLDDGFASGLLGKDNNADADRKLRDQVTKSAALERKGLAEAEASLRQAKDGNSAVGLGLALSGAGLHDKALALFAQGLAKGGLRRPDEAQLHLAIAQWRAGKADEAQKSFAAVKGNEGAASLARLWTMFLEAAPRP